jgi:hypothetical protein
VSGSTLPTVITAQELQPQTAANLNAQLLANAVALSPGLTGTLPGTLIEDIASTDTGALLVMDSARIGVINSISPLTANPFLTYQLGQQAGIPQGQGSNASVFVVFSGPAGYVIQIGFTVSDGTNQYAIQDGGIIGTSGQTQPLFCLATNSNTFAIPVNTVTQIVTSVPTTITLTVTNPLAGTPLSAAQTIASYRAQVLQASVVAAVGTPPFLKTLIAAVPGVNPALVSIQSVSGGWKIIVGGSGDPYLIAFAILQGVGDISRLVGSTLGVANFTAANPGLVTTTINHGYATGQVAVVSGVSPGGYNGTYTITVLTEKTFSVGVNTSGFGTYASGGVITPNFRNEVVSINNYPDNYSIPYVIPPSQAIAMAVVWNTISTNFVSASSVAQLASAALVQYVNGIGTGAPINVDVMIATFQEAVSSVLSSELISTLTFSVSINGVATSPNSGTVLIYGDPESYMNATTASIVVEQS